MEEAKELLLFNPLNDEHLSELMENYDFYGKELKSIISDMWKFVQEHSPGHTFKAEGDVYVLRALNPNAPVL